MNTKKFVAEGSCTGEEIKDLLVMIKDNLMPEMPEKEFRELVGINAKFPLQIHSIGHLHRLCDQVNGKDLLKGKKLHSAIRVWVE